MARHKKPRKVKSLFTEILWAAFWLMFVCAVVGVSVSLFRAYPEVWWDLQAETERLYRFLYRPR